MLEREGFNGGGYIDIFDGGPTLSVDTDRIRTVQEARELVLSRIVPSHDGEKMMLAAGGLADFVAGYGHVSAAGDETATLDAAAAASLGLACGDRFLAIGR
jgi:arginine N-succinyltransferase